MLSVCINHYRKPVALKLCLDSVAQILRGYEHEVIVTDSAAMAETKDMMLHDYPDVKYVPFDENTGFARLINECIKLAKGDPILFLNADTILTDGAIEKMLEHLKSNENVGMVGPRLEYMNGKHQPSAFRFYKPFTILARRTPLGRTSAGKKELNRFTMKDKLTGPPDTLPPMAVDWLMGSVMLVKRKAIDEVGDIDTRYFLYMEDVDWCRRFWEKKWSVVWIPSARVVHVHGQASKKRGAVLDIVTNKLSRVHLVSAFKYFKKFGLKIPNYGV